MEEIAQQFIIDCLKENNIGVPEELADPLFTKLIHDIGFELPSKKFYSKYMLNLNKRYPDRFMIPFAKSLTDDDTVAFLIRGETDKGSIIYFHDFTRPGAEYPQFFKDLSIWLNLKERQKS